MRREPWMHCSPFLKAGLRRISLNSLLWILFLFSAFLLTAEENHRAFYSKGDDGTLVLSFLPDSIPEKLILKNIEEGHKSEIFISYRIQMRDSRLGSDHLEIHIRRTGFRDKITGDYILLLNGQEVAVFREWNRFYQAFSASLVYPSGILLSLDQESSIRIRERIIYKKLVPPFSILYLIPGKFIRQFPWKTVPPGGIP